MIDNVVAALGLGLNLTDEEIADVLWLAVQMQQFGDGVISEQGDRNEALENSVSNRESPKQPAQPLRDADRDRQDENKKDEQNFEVHSKNAQNDDRSTRRSDELQLKIPDARSLQKPLELARSLRPLMRRVPSQVNTLLDEEATVRRIAEEKIWCPVLRPALEPWLDLALVIDDSASMLMWRHTIAELQHFLSSYGVFRDVRVWRLGTDKAEKVCIYAGATASDRNGSPRSPSELIEANGRGLVLVVSDCIAPIWRNGAIATALQIWSRSGMVAILQMLPDWLWGRTALGRGVAAQFSALAAGIPNYQLTTTTVSTWYDIDLATSIKIPVVTLEPEKFTAWAEMLAGKGGAWSAGIVFEPELFAGQEVAIEFDGAGELDAEDRVQSFRLTASPIARRLAGLLAAAPVISLPIVRILQSKVLTQSQPVHVAEVFLGGLLKPLSEITAKTNPNDVKYDFIEGVRDLLLESVPSSEIVNIVAEVSEYIANRLGVSLEEFGAVIRNPRQIENSKIVGDIGYFATITAQVLRRLGGEYIKIAEELDVHDTYRYSESLPNIRYQVGGCLSLDSSSYIKRKADDEIYKALKSGQLCIVSAPRQTGKSSLRLQTIKRLQEDGFACTTIDLASIGGQNNVEQFYASLIDILVSSFELQEKFDLENWLTKEIRLTPARTFIKFIEEILFKEISQHIVIFIDEFESIINTDFKEDFCSLLRSLKQRFNKLNFVLLGLFSDSELNQTPNVSPLTNIAFKINLDNFSLEEALPLANGFTEKTREPQKLIKEILQWTGGQPFLTQKVCSLVKHSENNVPQGNEKVWLANLIRTAIIENWEEQDAPIHLTTIQERILSSQKAIELFNLYRIISLSENYSNGERERIQELILSGLVLRQDNQLKVANRIYGEIFDSQWTNQNLARFLPKKIDVSVQGGTVNVQNFNIGIAERVGDRVRILVVAANPLGSSPLSLDNEVKTIQEVLRRSRKRDNFTVEYRLAATPSELRRALLDVEPHILHFSGHGSGENGLLFVSDESVGLIYRSDSRKVRSQSSDTNEIKFVSAQQLANLLQLCEDHLECVVLNACYTDLQGNAISAVIPFMIGIRNGVENSVAIKFSQSFYDAIGSGKTYEKAFAWGKAAIKFDLDNNEAANILVFEKKGESSKLAASIPTQDVLSASKYVNSAKPNFSLGIAERLEKVGERVRILVVAANPLESAPLKLDYEVKTIQNALRRSRRRDNFMVESRLAATPSELRRALLDLEPNVLHFCGHGAGQKGLLFISDESALYRSEDGTVKSRSSHKDEARYVPAQPLANLLRLHDEYLECVVLNACYSDVQGNAIADCIPITIGMRDAVQDNVAIKFSQGFYDAIGAGKTYEQAFAWGKVAIEFDLADNESANILVFRKQHE
jgi:hypothetical protein